MNVGIGKKTAPFNFWEYINRIFNTVYDAEMFEMNSPIHSPSMGLSQLWECIWVGLSQYKENTYR
jgi:hypothetical protein